MENVERRSHHPRRQPELIKVVRRVTRFVREKVSPDIPVGPTPEGHGVYVDREEGFIIREPVSMLKNPSRVDHYPNTILYADGSDESLEVFNLLKSNVTSFALASLKPGNGVFVHFRNMGPGGRDIIGLERIKRVAEGHKRFDEEITKDWENDPFHKALRQYAEESGSAEKVRRELEENRVACQRVMDEAREGWLKRSG